MYTTIHFERVGDNSLPENNLEQMYKAFVRSSLEYGNLEYLSACDTHKEKLDRVQRAAERMGGFSVQSTRSCFDRFRFKAT